MVEPMVRRLPVLQNTEPEDQRPAWHWLLIGAGFIVTVWLPLGMLGSWAGSRIVSSWLGAPGSERMQEFQQYASGAERLLVVLAQSGLPWLAYAMAGLIAGLLMGRFGTRAQVREAVGASGVASAGLVVLAVLGGALSAPLVLLMTFVILWGTAAVTCGLGRRIGARMRHAAATSAPK